MDDVVIEDQCDGFGSSVLATQLFQHGDKQGWVFDSSSVVSLFLETC